MDSLTNDSLRGIYENNFELAHAAISVGRALIGAGKAATVRDILKEIKKHPRPRALLEEDEGETLHIS